jgi:hypothetical protein
VNPLSVNPLSVNPLSVNPLSVNPLLGKSTCQGNCTSPNNVTTFLGGNERAIYSVYECCRYAAKDILMHNQNIFNDLDVALKVIHL